MGLNHPTSVVSAVTVAWSGVIRFRHEVDVERDLRRLAVSVRVQPHAEEALVPDFQPGLFLDLAACGVPWVLIHLAKPPGDVPVAGAARASGEREEAFRQSRYKRLRMASGCASTPRHKLHTCKALRVRLSTRISRRT